MANRRAATIPLRDLTLQGRTTAALPEAPDGHAATREVEFAAKEFGGLANLIGHYADKAAVREASEKGTLAGLTEDNLQLRRDGTLSGEAFDKAAIDTYAGKLDTNVRADMATLADKHKADPAGLTAALGELKGAYLDKAMVHPDLAAHFISRFDDRAVTMKIAATRARDAQVKAAAADAQLTAIETAVTDLQRSAYNAGGDEAAASSLANESARVKAMVANGVRAGYMSKGAGHRLVRSIDADIAGGQVAGQFDRLGSVEEKSSFLQTLDADYRAGKGPLAAIDVKTYSTMRNKLDANIRQHASLEAQTEREIQAQVNGIHKRVLEGYGVRDEEWQGLERLAARSTSPQYQDGLTAARQGAAEISKWWQMKPDELDAAIRTERGRIAADAAPAEVKRLAAADHVLGKMRGEIKNDALGLAERTGRVAPTTLTPDVIGDPDAAAAAFTKRRAAAEQAAASFGIRPQYFNSQEREQWSAVLNAGGDGAVAAVNAMEKNWGEDVAARAIGELQPKSTVMAHAGAVAASGGSSQFLFDVARQRAMAAQPGFKPTEFKPSQVNKLALDEYGAAFSEAPAVYDRAINAAKAAYDARARSQGFALDLAGAGAKPFRQVLQEAAGAVYQDGVQYGGIAPVNGRRTVLPPNVRADSGEDLLATLRDEDFAEPPIGSNGKALRVSDIRTGKLAAVGNGRYRVATGDPDGARPGWMADANGRPWVLDLKALEPILRSRRPDLYRGYGGAPLPAIEPGTGLAVQ